VSHLLASSSCSGAELRAGLHCVAAAAKLGPLLEDILAALASEEGGAAAAMPAHSALRCLGKPLPSCQINTLSHC
jgi:hypothetical protein